MQKDKESNVLDWLWQVIGLVGMVLAMGCMVICVFVTRRSR